MLDLKVSNRKAEIAVSRRALDVVFTEDFFTSLKLTLPSMEELQATQALANAKFSASSMAQSLEQFNVEFFAAELEKLRRKASRFSKSPTYVTRLADLAFLARRFDLEESFLREGLNDVRDNRALSLRLAELLTGTVRVAEARELLQKENFGSDFEANLRLAQLSAIERNFLEAEKYVSKALEVDNANARAQMFAGALSLAQGDFARAIRSFRVAAEEKGGSSVLHANLAIAHYCLGQSSKAIKELRTAIAINPLNENAVAFFADLLTANERAGEAIGTLETFLKYEQKSVAIWDRLARAYYLTGQYRRALESLQHQASLKDDPMVWNNIGLVNIKLSNSSKAKEYFVLAIKRAQEASGDAYLPVSNLLTLLLDERHYDAAYELSKNLVTFARSDWGKDKFLSRIYVKYLFALTGKEQRVEAADKARLMLKYEIADPEVEIDILLYLIYHLTIYDPSKSEAMARIQQLLAKVHGSQNLREKIVVRSLNNAMFSLLHFDQIVAAESISARLLADVHRDPFVTATFGLLNIKKGKLDRGRLLYEKAVTLATDRQFKHKIKQRMNLELGKAYLSRGESDKAYKMLEKAANEKYGFDVVATQSRELISSTRH